MTAMAITHEHARIFCEGALNRGQSPSDVVVLVFDKEIESHATLAAALTSDVHALADRTAGELAIGDRATAVTRDQALRFMQYRDLLPKGHAGERHSFDVTFAATPSGHLQVVAFNDWPVRLQLYTVDATPPRKLPPQPQWLVKEAPDNAMGTGLSKGMVVEHISATVRAQCATTHVFVRLMPYVVPATGAVMYFASDKEIPPGIDAAPILREVAPERFDETTAEDRAAFIARRRQSEDEIFARLNVAPPRPASESERIDRPSPSPEAIAKAQHDEPVARAHRKRDEERRQRS